MPRSFASSSGGGGIGGSTGSTDNAILRADGTGGSTVQASGVTITDANKLIFPDASVAADLITLYTNYVIGLNIAAMYFRTGSTFDFVTADFNIGLQVDQNSTAGNTRMLVYDVDNATLERVSVGAADSGGTGFKVLRLPN